MDEKEFLIMNSAIESNILPITSRCDASCIFCSHKNNPAGIHVVAIKDRTLDELEFTMSQLKPDRQITIGESATSIIEGEPLCHPLFKTIIQRVREKFPQTPIALTTNGHGLNYDTVLFLKELGLVTVNLSINSSSVAGRAELMKDNKAQSESVALGVALMKQLGLPFHSSIVAMAHIVGWEDIEATVRFLDANGARVIRLFLPGFSDKTESRLKFDQWEMFRDLREFVDKIAGSIVCPLLIEPSFVKDLTPVISGIMPDTKAKASGMLRGDIVISVNKVKPRARTEAWSMISRIGMVKVQFKRDSNIFEAEWENLSGEDPGVIMEYDFDVGRMNKLKEIVESCGGKVLALTSEFGRGIFGAVIDHLNLAGKVDIQATKNTVFGGSIGASGLLSVTDFLLAYNKFAAENPAPELILIPIEPFDFRGFDLTKRHFEELSSETGIKVAVV